MSHFMHRVPARVPWVLARVPRVLEVLVLARVPRVLARVPRVLEVLVLARVP